MLKYQVEVHTVNNYYSTNYSKLFNALRYLADLDKSDQIISVTIKQQEEIGGK